MHAVAVPSELDNDLSIRLSHSSSAINGRSRSRFGPRGISAGNQTTLSSSPLAGCLTPQRRASATSQWSGGSSASNSYARGTSSKYSSPLQRQLEQPRANMTANGRQSEALTSASTTLDSQSTKGNDTSLWSSSSFENRLMAWKERELSSKVLSKESLPSPPVLSRREKLEEKWQQIREWRGQLDQAGYAQVGTNPMRTEVASDPTSLQANGQFSSKISTFDASQLTQAKQGTAAPFISEQVRAMADALFIAEPGLPEPGLGSLRELVTSVRRRWDYDAECRLMEWAVARARSEMATEKVAALEDWRESSNALQRRIVDLQTELKVSREELMQDTWQQDHSAESERMLAMEVAQCEESELLLRMEKEKSKLEQKLAQDELKQLRQELAQAEMTVTQEDLLIQSRDDQLKGLHRKLIAQAKSLQDARPERVNALQKEEETLRLELDNALEEGRKELAEAETLEKEEQVVQQELINVKADLDKARTKISQTDALKRSEVLAHIALQSELDNLKAEFGCEKYEWDKEKARLVQQNKDSQAKLTNLFGELDDAQTAYDKANTETVVLRRELGNLEVDVELNGAAQKDRQAEEVQSNVRTLSAQKELREELDAALHQAHTESDKATAMSLQMIAIRQAEQVICMELDNVKIEMQDAKVALDQKERWASQTIAAERAGGARLRMELEDAMARFDKAKEELQVELFETMQAQQAICDEFNDAKIQLHARLSEEDRIERLMSKIDFLEGLAESRLLDNELLERSMVMLQQVEGTLRAELTNAKIQLEADMTLEISAEDEAKRLVSNVVSLQQVDGALRSELDDAKIQLRAKNADIATAEDKADSLEKSVGSWEMLAEKRLDDTEELQSRILILISAKDALRLELDDARDQLQASQAYRNSTEDQAERLANRAASWEGLAESRVFDVQVLERNITMLRQVEGALRSELANAKDQLQASVASQNFEQDQVDRLEKRVASLESLAETRLSDTEVLKRSMATLQQNLAIAEESLQNVEIVETDTVIEVCGEVEVTTGQIEVETKVEQVRTELDTEYF